MVLDVVLKAIGGVAAGVALGAGAPRAEVVPRKDSVLVAVVPVEVDSVVARLGDYRGTELRLEHWQRTGGFGRGRFIGQEMALQALFVA
jgi:hypothetical protein